MWLRPLYRLPWLNRTPLQFDDAAWKGLPGSTKMIACLLGIVSDRNTTSRGTSHDNAVFGGHVKLDMFRDGRALQLPGFLVLYHVMRLTARSVASTIKRLKMRLSRLPMRGDFR